MTSLAPARTPPDFALSFTEAAATSPARALLCELLNASIVLGEEWDFLPPAAQAALFDPNIETLSQRPRADPGYRDAAKFPPFDPDCPV